MRVRAFACESAAVAASFPQSQLDENRARTHASRATAVSTIPHSEMDGVRSHALATLFVRWRVLIYIALLLIAVAIIRAERASSGVAPSRAAASAPSSQR